MVNTSKPPTVTAAPTSPGPRYIGTEQDAIEAFGENSEMHLWVREWLRQPAPPPVTLTRADGFPAASAAVSAALTALDQAVRVAALRWPSPLTDLHALALSYDPQGSPPLRCTIDGEPVPLERGADGVWRPRRTEGDA